MTTNDSFEAPERATPAVARRRRTSGATLFIAVALALVVGFVVGTRSQDILAAMGPVFGFKASSDTLDLSSVESTYQELKANYDGKLDTTALIDGASRGMVAAAGDQYTVFMDPTEAADFNKSLSGEVSGIGAEIGVRNSEPTIIRVIVDSPAEKAGLLPGDQLVSVNGDSLQHATADQAAIKVRGDAGTSVKLTVLRGGITHDFTIMRAKISDPSVRSRIVSGDIGVLTISRFDDQTAALAKQAAQNFKAQGVKGVILDLRDDGGGYLDAAQSVAGLWLDNQLVVTEKTGDTVVDQLSSGSSPILQGIHTVVLVNGSSASASEIVAGALQDHKAATLIGEKTFGKGSVQKVINLPGGRILKVTIARWYTPNGKNITKEGITPDKQVTLTADNANAGQDPQMDAALAEFGIIVN